MIFRVDARGEGSSLYCLRKQALKEAYFKLHAEMQVCSR